MSEKTMTPEEKYEHIIMQAMDIISRLAVNYDITAGTKFDVVFPWNRLFEVDIVKLQQDKGNLRFRSRSAKGLLPDVPVYTK